jgi:shikimate dehydrogenase
VIRVGLVGHPVAHSRSPALFDAALRAAGIDAAYDAIDVAPEDLPGGFERLRGAGYRGFNVTLPHKGAAAGWADELDPVASATGAVNCVVLDPDGRALGRNTDGPALLTSLDREGGFHPDGRRVLILGAGGSARAAAHALTEGGAEVLCVARRPELAATIPGVAEARPWAGGGRGAAADLLVQCTPLGMEGGPPEGAAALAQTAWAEGLSEGALVMDLVYVPARTPLLAEAARRGHPILGGAGMLVAQAEAAFLHWFGQVPPVGVMECAARSVDNSALSA